MAEADKAAEYVNVLSDSSRVALLALRTRSTPTVVRYQLLKNLSGVPEPAQNRAESSGRGVVVSHPLPYTSSSSEDDSLTAHVLERQISHPRVNQAASAALKRVWPHWQTLLLFLSVATAALARAFTNYLSQWQTLLLVIPVAAVLRWTGAAYRFLKKYHLDHESEEYQLALTELYTEVGRRLANVCRANGGVYVKAGQFATSFGALPREISAIRQVLLFELGPNAESLFSSFETTAVAAASIAQVHRARLSTGEEVVVKLQYPGLRSKELIGSLSQLLHLHTLLDPALLEQLEESRVQDGAKMKELQEANHQLLERNREMDIAIQQFEQLKEGRAQDGAKMKELQDANHQLERNREMDIAIQQFEQLKESRAQEGAKMKELQEANHQLLERNRKMDIAIQHFEQLKEGRAQDGAKMKELQEANHQLLERNREMDIAIQQFEQLKESRAQEGAKMKELQEANHQLVERNRKMDIAIQHFEQLKESRAQDGAKMKELQEANHQLLERNREMDIAILQFEQLKEGRVGDGEKRKELQNMIQQLQEDIAAQ
eukprot:gene18840-25388_t